MFQPPGRPYVSRATKTRSAVEGRARSGDRARTRVPERGRPNPGSMAAAPGAEQLFGLPLTLAEGWNG
jgi:hypothetical protein